MTQFVEKSHLKEELMAFHNMVHEVRVASDEKYLFKAV